jgi:S1-C subfamily serine protease
MNKLDALILLLAFLEAMQGARVGLLRQFFSLSGFWLGLVIGAAVSPWAVRLAAEASGKLLISFAVILGSALLVSTAGRALGHRLAETTRRIKLETVDKVLGAGFSVAVSLVIVWLLVSIFSGLPAREINRQISGSAIIRQLDETLPPAPAVLSRIARLINPGGFPHVFVGPERQPGPPVESANEEQIRAAVAAARASTVKIEGAGCGGLVNGSGFVAAPGLVITNAHVVAGIRQPTVIDQSGRHRATTVHFDPNTDLAILQVDNLAGQPLRLLDDMVPQGTVGVALGYPGGGPFRANGAGVRGQYNAIGRDIYNRRVVVRSIYELQTSIESGNSGGPVVLPDGRVIGVIFARSESADNTGYALTSDKALQLLRQAQGNAEPVSTGRCVAL